VKELARGGMGIVYEAMDQRLERRIAIKCAKSKYRKRLPPEVRSAREISHPNVCKIFEIHTASSRDRSIDFITMEFLDGETLTDRLQRGKLPAREAREIALQLCAGLGEAHRNQVVHGDLKSNNVILARSSGRRIRPVITDFGLARGMGTSGTTMQSGVKGGTPEYMAPELWKGEKASVASDVYALGVILYELASGRRPFDPGLSWEDRLTKKPPLVNRKWDGVLARCLDPDPAKRFASVDEITENLAPSPTRRWLLAGAALLALVVLIAVYAVERAKAPPQAARLAMLPLESSQELAPVATHVSRDIAAQLSRLKGSSQLGLTFIPFSGNRAKGDTIQPGVTHTLRGSMEQEQDIVTLRMILSDARTGVKRKEWSFRYKPTELRYAPVAIASMVTSSLHLPPVSTNARVNPAAREDYTQGLADVHGNVRADEAVKLMEKAVAEDPDSPLVYAGLAEAQWLKHLQSNNTAWPDRVKESVRQAELRNMDLAEVHVISGLVQQTAGAYEPAMAHYQRAIEIQPNNGDAYRRLSAIYNKDGQLNEALAAIQKAVQLEPRDFSNYQQLGAFYVNRGNYQDAVSAYQKMVDLAPGLGISHYSLGAALGDAGRLPEAEKELREAVRLQDSAVAEHTLGAILLDLGKSGEAISCFERARDLGDHTSLLWLNLGLSYSREGRDSDAAEAFQKGLAASEQDLINDPRDGAERARLAYLAARKGDKRRAEFEIAQALQIAHDDSEAVLLAVLTYETLSSREQALGLLGRSPSILVQLNRYPELMDLRRDPRYEQLLAKNKN
jgi:serine/threonine protein kinase